MFSCASSALSERGKLAMKALKEAAAAAMAKS